MTRHRPMGHQKEISRPSSISFSSRYMAERGPSADQGLVLRVCGRPSCDSLWTTLFKRRKKGAGTPRPSGAGGYRRHPLPDDRRIHGIGKTAFFLYPNLEYACACRMSFWRWIPKEIWRGTTEPSPPGATAIRWRSLTSESPTRSDGYNLLTLINHTADVCREDEKNAAARAKGAEVCQRSSPRPSSTRMGMQPVRSERLLL